MPDQTPVALGNMKQVRIGPFDTMIENVRNTIKKVGAELAAIPDCRDALTQRESNPCVQVEFASAQIDFVRRQVRVSTDHQNRAQASLAATAAASDAIAASLAASARTA